MFTREGDIMCVIEDVQFAEPKFATGPADFDIAVKVADETNRAESDWWTGEMSSNYGRGTLAQLTQREITMRTLAKCGFEGEDLTTVRKQLVGKRVPAHVEKTESKKEAGKFFYNVKYIGGGGNEPRVIDEAEMQRRLAALMAESGAAGAEPATEEQPAARPARTAPPMPTGGVNPFARTAVPAAGSAPVTAAKSTPF